MTNGEKHIEKLLSWYREAVTEDGVCYLTSDDKNTLAYAIKWCKHFEDIKKDIDSWMLREEPSSSEIPNRSEIPTSSDDCISRQVVDRLAWKYLRKPTDENVAFYEHFLELSSVTPIRPKGHWIDHSDEGYVECPICGSATNCDGNIADLHFCFSCGSEMEGVEK